MYTSSEHMYKHLFLACMYLAHWFLDTTLYTIFIRDSFSGIIRGMGSADERRRFIVTSPLSGWTHTQNDHWILPNGAINVLCWIPQSLESCEHDPSQREKMLQM